MGRTLKNDKRPDVDLVGLDIPSLAVDLKKSVILLDSPQSGPGSGGILAWKNDKNIKLLKCRIIQNAR